MPNDNAVLMEEKVVLEVVYVFEGKKNNEKSPL
jgi:hypothetical protein